MFLSGGRLLFARRSLGQKEKQNTNKQSLPRCRPSIIVASFPRPTPLRRTPHPPTPLSPQPTPTLVSPRFLLFRLLFPLLFHGSLRCVFLLFRLLFHLLRVLLLLPLALLLPLPLPLPLHLPLPLPLPLPLLLHPIPLPLSFALHLRCGWRFCSASESCFVLAVAARPNLHPWRESTSQRASLAPVAVQQGGDGRHRPPPCAQAGVFRASPPLVPTLTPCNTSI